MKKVDPPRSLAHDAAEAHFKQALQKYTSDAQVKLDQEAAAQASRDKTAKLKTLRLAKEATAREQ